MIQEYLIMINRVKERCLSLPDVNVYYYLRCNSHLAVDFCNFPSKYDSLHRDIRVSFSPSRFSTVTVSVNYSNGQYDEQGKSLTSFGYNHAEGRMEKLENAVNDVVKFLIEQHNGGKPKLTAEDAVDYVQTLAELYRL